MRARSHYRGDLASLNARVNRLLADDLSDGRFVTMASAIIDARGRPIQLLSAGHGPIVLLVEATGEVHDIMADGLPLAVMADADFGLGQSIALARGDVLALVTDGFVEWARPSTDGRREEFGLARLRESLRAHAHRTSKEIIECVAADVAAFAQREPQQDDLTMVIIRRDE